MITLADGRTMQSVTLRGDTRELFRVYYSGGLVVEVDASEIGHDADIARDWLLSLDFVDDPILFRDWASESVFTGSRFVPLAGVAQ